MKILNIGHRGFPSQYPENTMLSFEQAMKAGADGFECDLRLSADAKVVVFHDDDLKRLCSQKGTIEEMNWSEIQKLRVKAKGKTAEAIPSLTELLTHFHTTTINLEIKASPRDPATIVEAVLRELTKIRPQGRIVFSSFDPEIVKCLKLMDPKKTLGSHGILVETENIADLPAWSKDLEPDTWNVPRQILGAPWAKRWKDYSKIPPLWTWTMDEPDDWEKVLQSDLPFEAIITNKPEALTAFLNSRR